jgi:hypothetical protein
MAMPVDDGPPAVAEIRYGGEAGRELPGEDLDGLAELGRAQAGQPVEGVGLIVAAQVGVRVDESGAGGRCRADGWPGSRPEAPPRGPHAAMTPSRTTTVAPPAY